MKTILLSILLCTTCVFGKKISSPPMISDIAGEWIGTEGTETFYLRLKEDASGKSVYILGNAEDGSISLITKWTLNNRQITITCVGMTYPLETYTIEGQATSWEMNVKVRGKTEGDTWDRELRLRPVKSIEREISLGRQRVGTERESAQRSELIRSLRNAAIEGNIHACKQAIAAGADVNMMNVPWAPLHLSAREGHKKVVKLLIVNGADVNAKSDWDESTPLHFAVRQGHKEIVDLLIVNGGDLNARKDDS